MKYHFKFAIREMGKNKLITLGSIFSLVLGALSVMLIYLWAHNERSMDQMHTNVSRIYMPVAQQSSMDIPEFVPAKRYFKFDYKQFAHVINDVQTALYPEDRIKLKFDDTEYRARGLVTDSSFFKIFDFELLSGDPATLLKSPDNMVISESLAQRIFKGQDPLGKTLYLECDRKGYYQVVAIMKDIPSNSSIHFDFAVPRHSQKWWGGNSEEFILVDDAFDQKAFEEEFKYMGRNHPQFKESVLSIVPFEGLYFDNYFTSNLFVKKGSKREVQTLLAVAVVVLLVSAFNYTNLQTTITFSYQKVRGIKQVHGATSMDFWLEALAARLVQGAMSLGLVFLLFELVKTRYLSFLGITQNVSTIMLVFYMGMTVLTLLTISMLFSAIQTSRLVTSAALSGQLNSRKQNNAGKAITTLQYILATSLIIVTALVFKQFYFMINKDLGYKTENVVSIKYFDEFAIDFDNPQEARKLYQKQTQDYQFVKAELSKIPGVLSYSQGELPVKINWKMSWKLAKSDFDYGQANITALEPGYDEVFDLKMIKGRFFSDSLDQSRQHKVVINRAAMDYWGIDDLEGVYIASSSWDGEDDPWRVIGVVEDFQYEHLSQKVNPLVMTFFNDMEADFVISIAGERFGETMDALEELYLKVKPEVPFDYELLKTELQSQYDRERKLSDIFILFTITGLIISSVGLFTFALYETRKRIKEIGVRKVIGANVFQVVRLLSLSLLKWVLLAFLIACPISWYFMSAWLSNFANQTEMNWWIFLGAGLSVALLGWVTVIWQTWEVAKRNPVQALRYE